MVLHLRSGFAFFFVTSFILFCVVVSICLYYCNNKIIQQSFPTNHWRVRKKYKMPSQMIQTLRLTSTTMCVCVICCWFFRAFASAWITCELLSQFCSSFVCFSITLSFLLLLLAFSRYRLMSVRLPLLLTLSLFSGALNVFLLAHISMMICSVRL